MNLSNTHLEFREGSSDKVYDIAIEEQGSGYVVNFSYGRRGSSLNTGTKTSSPVSLDEAQKVYDKIVKEKLGKGYQPVGGGAQLGAVVKVTPIITVATSQERDTKLRPQLLVAISEDEAERYLTDDDWCAQEKFDGKRMTIRKTTCDVIAANKKGLSIGFPNPIREAMDPFMSSFVTDGEAVGERLFVFDLLEINGGNLRPFPYSARLVHLNELLGEAGKAVEVAKTAIGTDAKRKLMADLKAAGKEGIVFKCLSARWSAGRPESGGPALKCKFWSSVSCVVIKHNTKRSVDVALSGQYVGKVTIPPNWEVPKVGQCVEVKYLYVVGVGGSLYQPIYLGPRDDVGISECTFEAQKLKYKAENED